MYNVPCIIGVICYITLELSEEKHEMILFFVIVRGTLGQLDGSPVLSGGSLLLTGSHVWGSTDRLP